MNKEECIDVNKKVKSYSTNSDGTIKVTYQEDK